MKLYLVFLIFNFHLVNGKMPGFKARITQAGLTYADQVAIDQLAKSAQGQKLPDQSGRSGDVKYDISSIVIKSFSKPAGSITVTSDGLIWKANGLGITMSGHFHYKYSGFIKISDSGSIDVSVQGVSFSVGISLGVDSTGRPTIASKDCSCSIGRVRVDFHGGAAFIYNLFKGYVEDALKKQLNGQLCKLIDDAVNKDASKALAGLKVTTDIAKVFTLDYSFIGKPAFDPQHFFETYHKGEVFWTGSTTEPPFDPLPMPQINSTDKMFYMWVSDFVFNSMAYQAQSHGFLKYNLTQKDLPEKDRYFLNTSCTESVCIGALIPQIHKHYPNRHVTLEMSSDLTPQMSVVNGKVEVKGGGIVKMVTDDGIFLLSLNASTQASLTVTVKNEKIYASIADMKLKLHVVKSSVGEVNDSILNLIANTAIITVVEPKLNELGAKGIPLPVTEKVRFVNADITLDKNVLMIGTDLKYE